MKRDYVFSFRTILPKQLDELLQSVDVPEADVRARFDTIEKDGKTVLRRKPVTAELELPEFAANLPALAQDVLLGYVASYVKAQFLDSFLPVGSHSWAEIEQYAATRGAGGRRAEFDVTKEQLEEAATSIGRYMAAKLNNKAAGDKFKAAVQGRYAKSAIHRNIGKFDETIIDKLLSHLEGWLEFVAVNEADSADEFATVYAMLEAKLKAHKGATAATDVADLL
jgi:hypothetical protein